MTSTWRVIIVYQAKCDIEDTFLKYKRINHSINQSIKQTVSFSLIRELTMFKWDVNCSVGEVLLFPS